MRATFNFVVWNRTGDGRNEVVGTIAANKAGVATVVVPLHAVLALTTKPVCVPMNAAVLVLGVDTQNVVSRRRRSLDFASPAVIAWPPTVS